MQRYARLGRDLVLIGHPGQQEVEGTRDVVSVPVHVVSSAAEVAARPMPGNTPLAYVTQTTVRLDETQSVIDALRSRHADLDGPGLGDICYASRCGGARE